MIISIGFSKPIGNFKFFSHAIRLVEKRDFSHAYIVIDNMVYQAAHGMVHCLTLQNFHKNNTTLFNYEIEISEECNVIGIQFLKNTLGTRYGFDQIIGIFIQKIFRKTEPVIVNNSQGMICSELCARYLNLVGIEINVPFDSITPSDLHAILEINYGKNK